MMKSYVINLDRNPDRLNAITRRFSELGISFERYAAIDGAAFTNEQIDEFTNARPRAGQPWLRGQIGCFLSHYNIWQKIANGHDDYAAVFEDDVHASDRLPAFLQDTKWIPDGCDLVRLETSTSRVLLSKPVTHHQGRAIHELQSTCWGMGAYVISKKAAQRLLAFPISSHNTADRFVLSREDSLVPHELMIAQVIPALCTQDKVLGSSKDRNQYVSDISDEDVGPSLKSRMRSGSKPSLFRALMRTIRGYKRIAYVA